MHLRKAWQDYESLLDAKKKEIGPHTASTESKTPRIGELAVSAGHLNVLPPRRLNESVRRIIDYSESSVNSADGE